MTDEYDPIAELEAGYDPLALCQTLTPWALDWDWIVANLDGSDTRMYRQACALAELWRDGWDEPYELDSEDGS